jgi:amino acid transporter
VQQITAEGLIRGVRRWDVVALMINGTIGAGIFGLPSKVYALTNTYSVLAFVACALIVALVALCSAEIASRFTQTGGLYLYAREAFGSVVGFAVGWLSWLARVSALALICNVLVDYLSFFWKPVGSGVWRVVVITSLVVVLAIINIIGVSGAAVACDIFAIGKLIPLVLFV